MRAIEYLAANETSIRHLARIRTVLSDLRPLRSDKQATDRYCNEHLFSAVTLPADTAVEFRHQLFEVIKDDPTYGYLMHNLALERNRIASFYNAAPVQCVPDDREIRAAISASRDDYPKATLDDYLEDDFNYAFYSDNSLTGSSADILAVFNKAYAIYDEIRLRRHRISLVRDYIASVTYATKDERRLTLLLVSGLIDTFSSADERLLRIREDLLPDPEAQRPSSDIRHAIRLNPRKGNKVNLIRVFNVLYEMDYFTGGHGGPISKKDAFASLGGLLGLDLSDYQNDLSAGKAAANSDFSNILKVFDTMKDKQMSILERK